MTANELTAVFEQLEKDSNKKTVELKTILERFKKKGFGILLLVPSALLAFPPIGAIPGVPFLLGLVIAIVSIQLIIGIQHPWLPRKILALSINSNRIKKGIKKLKPITKFIDTHTKHRLSIFTYPPIINMIGIISLAFSIIIMVIGFIPFLPCALSIGILFLAVGLIAKDGVVILSSFILSLVFCGLLYSLAA